jgi:hypothetical protein
MCIHVRTSADALSAKLCQLWTVTQFNRRLLSVHIGAFQSPLGDGVFYVEFNKDDLSGIDCPSCLLRATILLANTPARTAPRYELRYDHRRLALGDSSYVRFFDGALIKMVDVLIEEDLRAYREANRGKHS